MWSKPNIWLTPCNWTVFKIDETVPDLPKIQYWSIIPKIHSIDINLNTFKRSRAILYTLKSRDSKSWDDSKYVQCYKILVAEIFKYLIHYYLLCRGIRDNRHKHDLPDVQWDRWWSNWQLRLRLQPAANCCQKEPNSVSTIFIKTLFIKPHRKFLFKSA